MNDSKVVEIEDLWFSYNGTLILKEVNLAVHERDFIAIIGPNGGGKTTLVKLLIERQLQDTPSRDICFASCDEVRSI